MAKVWLEAVKVGRGRKNADWQIGRRFVILLRLYAQKWQLSILIDCSFPEKGPSNALMQTSKRLVAKMQSTVAKMEFETLKLTQHGDNILNVELNRPKKLNAMNKQFFK